MATFPSRRVFMAKVTMSVKDLEQVAGDSIWYPICPNCEQETPAEPDAQYVYCIVCNTRIEIDNPYGF